MIDMKEKYIKFVFVYGNNMRTFKGNDIFKPAKYVGEFTTKGDHYAMCICNGIPCAYETVSIPSGGKLKGEVYKVTEEQAKKLEDTLLVQGVSYASEVELKHFKKRVRTYLIFDPPTGSNQQTFLVPKPSNGVYSWSDWVKNTTAKTRQVKQHQPTKETKIVAQQSTANQNVPTVFNPIVEAKDGSTYNRASLAYELLGIHDLMDYALSDTTMSDEDRGTYLREEMANLHRFAKKINGVL